MMGRWICSDGLAVETISRPARSKRRVGPCDLSGSLGHMVPKVGGHSVRLDSQSSENCPLSAVEG